MSSYRQKSRPFAGWETTSTNIHLQNAESDYDKGFKDKKDSIAIFDYFLDMHVIYL